MTLAEFKARFTADQKHNKRLRLYQSGHTDQEISSCCGVSHWTIGDWRRKNKLQPNIVIHAKGFKEQISKRIRGAKQA